MEAVKGQLSVRSEPWVRMVTQGKAMMVRTAQGTEGKAMMVRTAQGTEGKAMMVRTAQGAVTTRMAAGKVEVSTGMVRELTVV